MKIGKIAAIGGFALVIAACGSPKDPTKSNFSKAIQAYLDTQQGLCARIPADKLPFTLENKGWFGDFKERADALVDAGLLTKQNAEIKAGNKMAPATEYQISDLGKKYLIPDKSTSAFGMGRNNAFCSGKYAMVEVDNFTEPSEMMGMKVSQVNFRYKLDGADDWTKTEALRTNFKNFAAQSNIEGKATLILTDSGWMHERLFRK